MKISEMTNDQATEALIRISEPISNICDNEEFVSMLSQYAMYGKLPFIQAIGKILPKLVTFALRDHKQDIYEIIAALQMKPTSAIGNMNFKDTLKILQDSYDEILRDFFSSFASAIRTGAKG